MLPVSGDEAAAETAPHITQQAYTGDTIITRMNGEKVKLEADFQNQVESLGTQEIRLRQGPRM